MSEALEQIRRQAATAVDELLTVARLQPGGYSGGRLLLQRDSGGEDRHRLQHGGGPAL